MSVENVRAALATAYLAATNLATEWENVTFTAPKGAPWNSVQFAPNVPVPVTCGPDGEDEATGYFQVTCCCPKGKGEKLALEQVTLLLTTFKTGSKFTYGGQEVLVTSAGRAPGFASQEWYKIPFTVFFLARHNRNTPVYVEGDFVLWGDNETVLWGDNEKVENTP